MIRVGTRSRDGALPTARAPLARVPMKAEAIRSAMVAAAASGSPDVVDHDVSHLPVPVHDADALAGAGGALLTDTRRRMQMAEAGGRLAVALFGAANVNRAGLAIDRQVPGSQSPDGVRGDT